MIDRFRFPTGKSYRGNLGEIPVLSGMHLKDQAPHLKRAALFFKRDLLHVSLFEMGFYGLFVASLEDSPTPIGKWLVLPREGPHHQHFSQLYMA